MQKAQAIQLLERGLNANLGYGNGSLIEEFFNNFDSACIEPDFIPLLKKLASRQSINFQDSAYFDDNSSGGFLHPTEAGKSFETEAIDAIQTIKTNFEKLSPTAKLLKSTNPKIIESTLDELIKGDSTEMSLFPILEQIAKENVYLISGDKARGFGALSKQIYLGDKANNAIQKIKENNAKTRN